MRPTDWAGITHELRSALELLHDRGFVVLGEPVAEGAARRGLLRRRRPAAVRYVQVLRTEDVLSAECVGPTSMGGTWEMEPVVLQQLVALGWRTPEEARALQGDRTPNFTLHVPTDQVSDLTDLLVASLQVLGAVPHQLVLTGG